MTTRGYKDNDGLHRHGSAQNWCFAAKGLDGRWHHYSTSTPSKSQARGFRNEWMRARAEGSAPTHQASWTVLRALEHHQEHRTALGLPYHTQQTERVFCSTLIRHLGARRLRDLQLVDFEAYQAARRAEVKSRPRVDEEGRGVRTINKELQLLRRLMRKAGCARAWDNYRPLKRKKFVRGIALDAGQKLVLRRALASNPAWETVRWCVEAAVNCGMRGEEFKGLRLGQLHLADSNPWVYILRSTTKSDAGERRVPLNPEAAYAFAMLADLARQKGAVSPDHYLLPADLSKHTKAVDPLRQQFGFDASKPRRSMRTAFESACQLATTMAAQQFPPVAFPQGLRFHDLRHAFISDMAEADVPLEVTREMVGHMSTEMTRYYTHIRDTEMRAAVNKLPMMGLAIAPAVVAVAQQQCRRLRRKGC